MFIRILALLAACLPGLAQAAADPAYYSVRPDHRECVSPLCGGVFMQQVNKPVTRCADRRNRPECYAAEIDGSALGLSADQLAGLRALAGEGRLLLRGGLQSKPFDNFGNLGVFVATEAWEAASETPPRGGYFRAASNGTVCVAAPCRSYQEEKLNTVTKRDVAGLDLSGAGAGEAKTSAALARLAQPGGILLAATHRTVKGAAGKAPSLVAYQFYLPVDAATPKSCHVGGCSGQICSDQADMASTCEWRSEYACYRTARCERQTGGQCGWTPTQELADCLKKAGEGAVMGFRIWSE
ncbi:DUF6748 domain-containing protein [Methylomagnum sp.]